MTLATVLSNLFCAKNANVIEWSTNNKTLWEYIL